MEENDFLRKLIQQSPLDSPSDDFVDRVMNNLKPAQEQVGVKKSFFLYVKAVLPYALLTLLFAVVYATSDLPILNWLPGVEYLQNSLFPYLGSLLAELKNAFASKYVSFGFLIGISAGLLFLIDRFFSRRSTIQ